MEKRCGNCGYRDGYSGSCQQKDSCSYGYWVGSDYSCKHFAERDKTAEEVLAECRKQEKERVKEFYKWAKNNQLKTYTKDGKWDYTISFLRLRKQLQIIFDMRFEKW